jgi:S-adenosyl methyltransferase
MAEFDTSVPHIARIYDYWLGGKDNFAADRDAGDAAGEEAPGVASAVRGNRAFLARLVSYLTGEAGIRQFLDIGTGIPTADNTHEVAQRIAPECRITYVDNDPIVLSHARALLTSGPGGETGYVDADLRDTGEILGQAAKTLDFARPVAVMLLGILHCIPDADGPGDIVAQLMDAVPSGSYLAISHPARDIHAEIMQKFASVLNGLLPAKLTFRGRDEVTRFFAGLDLVEPGVVRVQDWRPDGTRETRNPAALWGGVARKP